MKYWEAPVVTEIADELIGKYHNHLTHAKVAYIFRERSGKRGNYVILGEARKPSEIDKSLHGFDFVMVIGHDMWEAQTEQIEKVKLVDHELSHMGYWVTKEGERKWVILEHDVQEFMDIINRYGIEKYTPIERREQEKD